MYLIYCLQNESFKDNILNFGITTSATRLDQFVADLNKTLLPTPYTIFLTKQVHNPSRIDIVYSLLSELVYDEIIENDVYENDVYENDVYEHDVYENDVYEHDIYENLRQETYRIVQGETEYIIPKMVEEEKNYDYDVPNILNMVNEIDLYYDRLSSNHSDYVDLDL
jgi:hypothetical protein